MRIAAVMFLFLFGIPVYAGISVKINTGTTYQTILGWNIDGQYPLAVDSGNPAMLRSQLMDLMVNDLGMTGVRWEVDRREWEDAVNDNDDPDSINWSSFITTSLDTTARDVILPLKQKVEARGEPFNLYISPSFFDFGSSGTAPSWMLNNPGEYAEWAIAFLTYIKNTYNILPNYYVICNEAGNGNDFSSAVAGRMIKALGPKLNTLFPGVKIQFPECTRVDVALIYIKNLQNNPDIWPYVGLISYHPYFETELSPLKADIYNFGLKKGIPTAMTEFMSIKFNHLYHDLTVGNTSYWGIYTFSDIITINKSKTSFSMNAEYWNLRQVMPYVRPGAVRVEASTDTPSDVRALAFVKNGKVTLVVQNYANPSSNVLNISGLPAGTYGVCQGSTELGLQVVDGSGTLSITLPSSKIITLYPYAGSNQPPKFTGYSANSSYMILPLSSTTLSASAADPENSALTYTWSIKSKPAGSNPVLAAPNAASTTATGLTIAGSYIFTVTVSDGLFNVSQDVSEVVVVSSNQPPVIMKEGEAIHNRLPVTVVLPVSNTELRVYAFDREDDPLTYRCSLISAPAGANPTFTTAVTMTKISVTGMTVSGDYVFKFDVSDPYQTATKNFTVHVWPANVNGPVISAAGASPSSITLPANTVTLTASTSDEDGDLLSHWWSINTKPDGANLEDLVFSSQGSRNTSVSGFKLAGTYVFTLNAVDRTKTAKKNVTITVNALQPLGK